LIEKVLGTGETNWERERRETLVRRRVQLGIAVEFAFVLACD